MKTALIIVIALAILLGGAALIGSGSVPDISSRASSQSDTAAEQETSPGSSDFDRLIALSFTDYEGNAVSLSNFAGKPVVINSWAVWCPFCRQELPDFAALQKEFGDQVTVIAIDRQEPLQKAMEYTDGLGISGDMLFLLDRNDSFYRAIGGFSMPETIFVSGTGDIVVHKRGPMDLAEIRQHTKRIIE